MFLVILGLDGGVHHPVHFLQPGPQRIGELDLVRLVGMGTAFLRITVAKGEIARRRSGIAPRPAHDLRTIAIDGDGRRHLGDGRKSAFRRGTGRQPERQNHADKPSPPMHAATPSKTGARLTTGLLISGLRR